MSLLLKRRNGDDDVTTTPVSDAPYPSGFAEDACLSAASFYAARSRRGAPPLKGSLSDDGVPGKLFGHHTVPRCSLALRKWPAHMGWGVVENASAWRCTLSIHLACAARAATLPISNLSALAHMFVCRANSRVVRHLCA